MRWLPKYVGDTRQHDSSGRRSGCVVSQGLLVGLGHIAHASRQGCGALAPRTTHGQLVCDVQLTDSMCVGHRRQGGAACAPPYGRIGMRGSWRVALYLPTHRGRPSRPQHAAERQPSSYRQAGGNLRTGERPQRAHACLAAISNCLRLLCTDAKSVGILHATLLRKWSHGRRPYELLECRTCHGAPGPRTGAGPCYDSLYAVLSRTSR